MSKVGNSHVPGVVWLFGRGASIACKLPWCEPKQWRGEKRNMRVEKIKHDLLEAMVQPYVNARPYKLLLGELAERSRLDWPHRFHTTNWDTLLQREITGLGLTTAPSWLPETHVFHLNGAVEDLPRSTGIPLRSPILLEDDECKQRTDSVEFNHGVEWMLWRHVFVVVGMSFSCPTDRALLRLLQKFDFSASYAWWLVISPTGESADETAGRIWAVLPKADVRYVASGFEEWVTNGMPELVRGGILEPSKHG